MMPSIWACNHRRERCIQPAIPALYMPLQKTTMSETSRRVTVHLVQTDHDAEDAEKPGLQGRRGTQRDLHNTRKPALNKPLLLSTTCAATTRNGGTRKARLPPLLPLPLAAPTRLQRRTRLLHSLCDTPLLLHLPLLPPPQCGLEEVLDRAGVHCLGRSVRQRRRGEERHRGDRECPTLRLRIRQDSGPLTSARCLLCPQAVRPRPCITAVMQGRSELHRDGLPLVPKHRAQPSGCCGGCGGCGGGCGTDGMLMTYLCR